jgi:hypothetical protein
VGSVRDRPPHVGFQQRLGGQGVIEILFTVVGHDSGGFAMIGVFFLVTAAMGFAASFELRRREQSDSIR